MLRVLLTLVTALTFFCAGAKAQTVTVTIFTGGTTTQVTGTSDGDWKAAPNPVNGTKSGKWEIVGGITILKDKKGNTKAALGERQHLLGVGRGNAELGGAPASGARTTACRREGEPTQLGFSGLEPCTASSARRHHEKLLPVTL